MTHVCAQNENGQAAGPQESPMGGRPPRPVFGSHLAPPSAALAQTSVICVMVHLRFKLRRTLREKYNLHFRNKKKLSQGLSQAVTSCHIL